MDIKHVIVLMLENRSFDCMLGALYKKSSGFDGLSGAEANIWHKPDGTEQTIEIWSDPLLTAQTLCIPDPDPGEMFTDIQLQIHGLTNSVPDDPTSSKMGGFVDSYMRQPPATPSADPRSVMHYFTPDQVPVISQLARAFGVSDRWHASAPCQTWPNRFFAHTGTAGGYVNNEPNRLPYLMKTVFNSLSEVGQDWRIYFHDVPQSATLTHLWGSFTHFHHFEEDFAADAAAGKLPAYSFIEPRYFPDTLQNKMPNDEHPPHNVAYGEALIASVYNAVRGGPGWKNTLLVITYDEHGGCYDHVAPPPATPPGGHTPDGFDFDSFGVRVPAVIVSPYVKPGSVIRPLGPTPFDHTSIIATLRGLFGIEALTPRDAAAPDLLASLEQDPLNDGPPSIAVPTMPPSITEVAQSAVHPQNNLQKSLSTVAARLPTAGADIGAHLQHLTSSQSMLPSYANVEEAAAGAVAYVKAFLGRF